MMKSRNARYKENNFRTADLYQQVAHEIAILGLIDYRHLKAIDNGVTFKW